MCYRHVVVACRLGASNDDRIKPEEGRHTRRLGPNADGRRDLRGPAECHAAEEASKSAGPMAARITALVPDLEAYIRSAMQGYDAPGLAIDIAAGDRPVLPRSSA